MGGVILLPLPFITKEVRMKKVSAAFLVLILVAFTLSAADIGADKVEGPVRMELNYTQKLEPDRATWQSGVWSGTGWIYWDYALYNYCKSQVIYHSDWMMDYPCDISKIGFYSFANSPTRYLKIFIGTTTETSFDGTGFLPNPPFLMFEGDVSWLDGGVTEITLDTSFTYDGVSNLLLVIEDWTGTWESSHFILGDNSSSSVNVTAFGYWDYIDPDYLTPDDGSYGGYYIEFPVTYWSYLLAGHDVGVTSILAPTGMYSIGETVTPKAIVKNFRDEVETFDVTYNIYDYETRALIYTDTESVDTLDPGEIRTVNFSPDIGTSQGAFTTEVFTALIGDEDPSNDTLWGSYYASMCTPVVVFYEDFSEGDPPCGWTVNDLAGSGWPWTTTNPGGRSPEGGCVEPFMIADDDEAGSGVDVETELISPSIDCSGYSKLNLSFSSYFHSYSWYDDYGDVDISVDGGVTWINILHFVGGNFYAVSDEDISSIAGGESDVRLRFYFNDAGEWGYYWMIDNVTIEGEPQCPVITEIMNNPRKVYDSEGEWFEIYNPSAEPIDINGWVIRDAGTDYHVIDVGDDTVKQELIIPAGGYVVLGRNADFATNGGYTCDYQYSDFYLSNTGDEIILEYYGVIIDSVYYHQDDPDWYDPNGASAELWDPGLDNMDLTNWDLAYQVYGDGDHGTPGAENHTAVDPHEPNDNLFEATEVDSGTNFEDCYIHKDLPRGKWYGDLDYYKLSGEAAGSLYVDVLEDDGPGGWLDCAIALLDSAGNIIARVDAGYLNEYLACDFPYTGDYYVLIAYGYDVPEPNSPKNGYEYNQYCVGPYYVSFDIIPAKMYPYDAGCCGIPNQGDPDIVNDTLVCPDVYNAYICVFNNAPSDAPAISFVVYYKLFDGDGNIIGSKAENIWDLEPQDSVLVYFQGGIPILYPGLYTAAVTIETAFEDPNLENNYAMREITVVEGVKMGVEEIPKVFALSGCEPNPVRGDAVIRYQIPKNVDVTLKVYDSSGRLVSTVVDETQNAGFYNIGWSPPHAGVYFAKLTAGDFRATKRILAIR